MKKLLLSFALAFAALIANGQSLSTQWYYEAVTGGIVDPALVNSSVAFNPQNNSLYVTNRGVDIYIVNPDDFNPVTSTLNSSAYSLTSKLTRPAEFAETTYGFTKVRVTSDGVIYAIAMSLNSPTYIYRWSSETDPAPTRTPISYTGGARAGDAFDVFGTGTNTYLYFAGANNPNLYIYKVDGTGVPQPLHTISLTTHQVNGSNQDIAKGSISAESNDVLWLKSFTPGTQYKRIKLNLTNGTITTTNAAATVNGTSMNFNFSNGIFVQQGGIGFMATYGATSDGNSLALKMFLYTTGVAPGVDGTPVVSKKTEVVMPKASFFATGNGQGIADVATRRNSDGTTTFYLLVNKNGLVAFKSAAPLPVSLTSFDAALVKGQSTLTWETASEANNSGFEVLRSTDGKDFTKIHFENSKGQNGNSTTALKYSFVDRTAKAGVNYYQLKQIDLNGDNELFKDVKSVNVSLGAADVVVFPNPATTYISVNAGGADFKDVKYELFDASGKRVLSEKATAEQQDISLSKLPASIYFLKISKNGTVQKTVKLVKQ